MRSSPIRPPCQAAPTLAPQVAQAAPRGTSARVRGAAGLLLAAALSACASAATSGDSDGAALTPGTCQRHADCPESGACRSEAAMPPGALVGQCYPAGAVALVDGARCRPGQGRGTREDPFCEPQEPIDQGFTVIVLTPRSSGSYAPVQVRGGPVTLFGPGRDAVTPAVLGGVAVPVRAGNVTLWDLSISGNDSDFAVTCSAGQLALRRVAVERSRGAVDASAGCSLVIDRSRLRDNNRAALRMDTNVRYVVVNSLIAGNGAGFSAVERSSMIDLVIDLASALRGNRFAFNTVVQNQGGVACRPGQVLSTSILTAAAGTGRVVPDPSCTLASSFTGMDGTPQLDSQFHLTESSTGCIDQAGQPGDSGQDPDAATDYLGTPRPQRRGLDIGFHELR